MLNLTKDHCSETALPVCNASGCLNNQPQPYQVYQTSVSIVTLPAISSAWHTSLSSFSLLAQSCSCSLVKPVSLTRTSNISVSTCA